MFNLSKNWFLMRRFIILLYILILKLLSDFIVLYFSELILLFIGLILGLIFLLFNDLVLFDLSLRK
jgi:hypothetical protein